MKKHKLYLLFSLLIIASMLLGACGGGQQAAAPATEETAKTEETAPPAQNQPAEVGEADLDGAFNALLGSMKAYNTIKLDALAAELAEDQPPFLLDVRTDEEVQKAGYIEGASHISLRDLAKHLDLLPSFDTPIVTYCGTGWRATIAMVALRAMGWENVRALKARFDDVIAAGYPVAEGLPEPMALNAAEPDAALVESIGEMLRSIPEGWGVIKADALNSELAEKPDLIVIDVRRDEEIEAKGYIDAPNYIHIPLEEFVKMQDKWPADKNAPVVTYCGSGHRSTMAMSILWAYGYTNVRSLAGGYAAWASAGYATIGGAPDLSGAFSAMLESMTAYNTIKMDGLNAALAEDTPPFLIDVRTKEEVAEQGHITGAVNIPLQELARHLDVMPSFDTPIVTYCGTGWRATIAMVALHAMGWDDVRALKAKFSDWVDAGYAVTEGPAEEALVLNVAQPDAGIVAEIDKMLSGIPKGYGTIKVDALNSLLVENPDLILIDVRRDDEVQEKGVIVADNYIHIPLEDFIKMQGNWPADKNAPIVVYCGSGHRSTMAMTILWTYGYADVHSLVGGFAAWVDAGYPVAEFAAP